MMTFIDDFKMLRNYMLLCVLNIYNTSKSSTSDSDPGMMSGRMQRRIQLEKGTWGASTGLLKFCSKLSVKLMEIHSWYLIVYLKYLIINKKECISLMLL
jgi:hypothetical protein